MASIYYFTGTGNCYMTAKLLGEALGEETKLIQITKELSQGTVLEECSGIVFPVYYMGLPHIVEEFLLHAFVKPSDYIFSVTTMGNFCGNAIPCVSRILKKKGCELQAGYEIQMPENYAPMFDAPSSEKQKEMFAQAEKKIVQIAEDVKNKRHTKLPSYHALFQVYHNISCRNMGEKDRKFTVNDSCIGCGKCEQCCPVGNITMEENRPVYHHQCEYCFACFHHCPQSAINCGKKTEGRTRYLNPYVEINM